MSAVMEEPVVTSREEARARGLKTFFTGKPCIYGHTDERLVTNRVCITCNRLNSHAHNRGQRREQPAPTVVSRREDARAQGLVKYFTGEPCMRGHLDYRRVATNQCCECQRMSQRGVLPPRLNDSPKFYNDGFTPDPILWPDDSGAKRVAIYDHNFNPPRLVRRVGWTNCLGRGPRHRIFSADVARERMCSTCKGMQARGTIDD
jgi:hypothetical protein